ncbi:MAG: RNA recognition motif domain-containing protein [Gammaproteobacteria bacterium]
MKKIFVGGLPLDASQASITDLFSEFGTVRSIELISDVFSGKCKGFGFVEMEGHEARAAIAGLHGRSMGERQLVVKFEDPKKKNKGRRR